MSNIVLDRAGHIDYLTAGGTCICVGPRVDPIRKGDREVCGRCERPLVAS